MSALWDGLGDPPDGYTPPTILTDLVAQRITREPTICYNFGDLHGLHRGPAHAEGYLFWALWMRDTCSAWALQTVPQSLRPVRVRDLAPAVAVNDALLLHHLRTWFSILHPRKAKDGKSTPNTAEHRVFVPNPFPIMECPGSPEEMQQHDGEARREPVHVDRWGVKVKIKSQEEGSPRWALYVCESDRRDNV